MRLQASNSSAVARPEFRRAILIARPDREFPAQRNFPRLPKSASAKKQPIIVCRPFTISHHRRGWPYPQSMPSLRALPQELIDKIIDELGEAHRDVSPDNHIDVAHEALHACTLVSKNWTGRSRTHLFKKVTIRADASGKSLIPPESLMPYIAELKIRMQCRRYHPFPSHKLLRPFRTAPITSLWITGGTLSPTKVPLVECIIALSATLHTVTFKSCSLSLSLILDIALKHPDLKRLHLRHCEVKPTNSDHHVAPRSDTHFTPLELGVFSGADSRGHELAVATVAQLPVRFGGLDFDYLQGPTVTRSSNALIGANAKSLSSLTAHIVNICMSRIVSQKGYYN